MTKYQSNGKYTTKAKLTKQCHWSEMAIYDEVLKGREGKEDMKKSQNGAT